MRTIGMSDLGKRVLANIIKEARTTIVYGQGLKIDHDTEDIVEACEEVDAWLSGLVRELETK